MLVIYVVIAIFNSTVDQIIANLSLEVVAACLLTFFIKLM